MFCTSVAACFLRLTSIIPRLSPCSDENYKLLLFGRARGELRNEATDSSHEGEAATLFTSMLAYTLSTVLLFILHLACAMIQHFVVVECTKLVQNSPAKYPPLTSMCLDSRTPYTQKSKSWIVRSIKSFLRDLVLVTINTLARVYSVGLVESSSTITAGWKLRNV